VNELIGWVIFSPSLFNLAAKLIHSYLIFSRITFLTRFQLIIDLLIKHIYPTNINNGTVPVNETYKDFKPDKTWRLRFTITT